MSIFDSIVRGLDESIKIEKGELKATKHVIKIEEIKSFSNVEVKSIRTQLNLTQVLFAQLLGVSAKTVEAWEKGTNKPNGTARRMLNLLKIDPKLPEKYNIISY